MSVSKIGLIWLRLAVVYFVAGVALGVVMGASGNHSLFPVHAHMNLLGWVSMGLFAYVHDRYPQLGNNWLSRAQLWLYNLGLPVMLASLAAMLSGNASMDPVIGISSLSRLLMTICIKSVKVGSSIEPNLVNFALVRRPFSSESSIAEVCKPPSVYLMS